MDDKNNNTYPDPDPIPSPRARIVHATKDGGRSIAIDEEHPIPALSAKGRRLRWGFTEDMAVGDSFHTSSLSEYKSARTAFAKFCKEREWSSVGVIDDDRNGGRIWRTA